MAAGIVTIMDDLFFLAKIRETAKVLGIRLTSVDAQGGPAAVEAANPRAIILDLNARSIAVLDWIRALKSDPATSAIRIMGFVSHVQDQLIADARAAGCDTVLARSTFSQKLPQLLEDLSSDGKRAIAAKGTVTE